MEVLVKSKAHGDVLVLIDESDSWAVKYNWYINMMGHGKLRVMAYFNGKVVYLHRLLLDFPKGVVDHINGNPLDNRRCNLRATTQTNNVRNSAPHKDRKSKYKGTCYQADRGKWAVYIRMNGKSKFLGRFTDEISAAKAYDKKAKELFGEYAWLNFPEEKT